MGATGQLGRAAVSKLQRNSVPVRALVRSAGAAARFEAIGVETALGDLTDPASLDRLCEGVAAVIATATAI